MSYEVNIREEELKNTVAQDYFEGFNTNKIIGDVDFCVSMNSTPSLKAGEFEIQSLLWAEAKKGSSDSYNSLVQLILTIGKARTFDKYLPPAMLGAFDAEKIAFIPYSAIHDIFYLNDFNWNVAPSNHDTREFQLVYQKIKLILDHNTRVYFYDKDDIELRKFIKDNFVIGTLGFTKTRIDKNNFIVIYNKWLQTVKPTISANWSIAKQKGVIDGDFYLADLLSDNNITLKDKLFVVLKSAKYELNRHLDEWGAFTSSSVEFNDNQKAHTQFWNKYERPPLEQYWDYIVERRDLLVPQDVRERKGSFFTPQIWVELSQKYLADVLGEDWQDEYFIWDSAAGTGNLLHGLTNKYNIWASTLDRQDVDVMKDRIKNGANLLEDHVFQFDFLNDEFAKLPKPLFEIINNPEKRKKLVVYMNPPYAEASSRATIVGKGDNKSDVATSTRMYQQFSDLTGTATRELFVQFFLRVYRELSDSYLASFSTLKYLSSQNFHKFRQYFKAKFEIGFIIPADSFDNVKGKFPIGFSIWNLKKQETLKSITCDVYNQSQKNSLYTKNFYVYPQNRFIIDWLREYYDKNSERIAFLRMQGTDIQNNRGIFITNHPTSNDFQKKLTTDITKNNVIQMCMYLAVRQSIKSTWLNDRDQFLYPNEGWKSDREFQNDCLAFVLFHTQNKISGKQGTNHWIPFSESEVNAREKFDSNFMSKFIKGKIKPDEPKSDIFNIVSEPVVHYEVPLKFSSEATAVFDAGRELWNHYHSSFDKLQTIGIVEYNVNASLYDIREHFQGRNDKGKMNSNSPDETYTKLISDLRDKLKLLAQKIEPKVYAYDFLRI